MRLTDAEVMHAMKRQPAFTMSPPLSGCILTQPVHCSTWDSYTNALRIYKHYEINLRDPVRDANVWIHKWKLPL